MGQIANLRELNPSEAISKLRTEAMAGNAKAALVLAEAYARGFGVPADEAEARRWAKIAVEADADVVAERLVQTLRRESAA